MKKQFAWVAGAVMTALLGLPAFAASTWNLAQTCSLSNVYSQDCGGSPTSVAVSGLSTGAGTTFAAAKVYNWGANNGLGVVAVNENSQSTGPHSVDNKYGTDALLLSFSSLVSLNSFSIGWNGTDNAYRTYTDSDMSVLAWTGSGAPSAPGTFAPNSMTGWTLIGNFFDVGADNTNPVNTQNFSTQTTSSYWLISAYNSAYSKTTVNNDIYVDAFKLLSVAGNTTPPGNQTPEPGSLALMGVALMGFMAVRRRSQKSV